MPVVSLTPRTGTCTEPGPGGRENQTSPGPGESPGWNKQQRDRQRSRRETTQTAGRIQEEPKVVGGRLRGKTRIYRTSPLCQELCCKPHLTRNSVSRRRSLPPRTRRVTHHTAEPGLNSRTVSLPNTSTRCCLDVFTVPRGQQPMQACVSSVLFTGTHRRGLNVADLGSPGSLGLQHQSWPAVTPGKHPEPPQSAT